MKLAAAQIHDIIIVIFLSLSAATAAAAAFIQFLQNLEGILLTCIIFPFLPAIVANTTTTTSLEAQT